MLLSAVHFKQTGHY